jgi:DNA-binding CsgD family transcriptional regulator
MRSQSQQSIGTHILRDRAMSADRASSTPLDCASAWNDLIGGSTELVDGFHNGERYYLVVGDRATPRQLDERGRSILEHTLLLGQPQKVVALDLRLAASTIAARYRQGLEFLGLACAPSRAPALLIMIGASTRTRCALHEGRQSEFSWERRTYRVLAAASSGRMLAGVLPPAEEQVLHQLLDGRSHAAIAALRGTSPRTIANQLATAFRRLGVSGRLQILALLCAHQSARANSEARAPEPEPERSNAVEPHVVSHACAPWA